MLIFACFIYFLTLFFLRLIFNVFLLGGVGWVCGVITGCVLDGVVGEGPGVVRGVFFMDGLVVGFLFSRGGWDFFSVFFVSRCVFFWVGLFIFFLGGVVFC